MLSRRNDDRNGDSMPKNPFQVPSEVSGGQTTSVETDHSQTSLGSQKTTDVDENENRGSKEDYSTSTLDPASDANTVIGTGVSEHDSPSDPQAGESAGDLLTSDSKTRDSAKSNPDDADPLAFLNEKSDGGDLDSSSFLDSGDSNDDSESGHGRHVWLWVVIGVVIALLVAGIGIGGYYMMNPKSQKIDNSSKVGGNTIGGSSNSADGDKENVSERKKFLDEAGVPDFYQVPKNDQSDEEKTEAVEYALATEPTNAVGRFMSKSSNPDLTDDPSQYLLEDGSTNPNYSYLTGENTTAVIRDDMERLVNPVYGGWTFLQDNARLDVNGIPQTVGSVSLLDMFDPDVISGENGEASLRDLTKIYADWDSNEYGGEWHGKYTGDPIVGRIVDYNCDYNIQGAMDDTISCVAQVHYSGVLTDENGSRTNKSFDRTLTLHYKVNYDPESQNGRRILLTSVEQ